MTTWTREMEQAEIARQFALIENRDVPMAVVDYGMSWRKTGANGRYGVRDLNHVSVYFLIPVRFNEAADRLCAETEDRD